MAWAGCIREKVIDMNGTLRGENAMMHIFDIISYNGIMLITFSDSPSISEQITLILIIIKQMHNSKQLLVRLDVQS